MAKMMCKCGNTLPLKTGVEEYECYLTKVFELYEIIDRYHKNIHQIKSESPWIGDREFQIESFLSEISQKSADVIDCPFCKRIWVFENGKVKCYILEGDVEIADL